MSSQLSTKFRHQITWNGYPLDLVKSGLQKYIRRGETEKALYCAGEVDLFKTAGKEGEIVRTNFLNRFLVIYMEDVENLALVDDINRLTTSLFAERQSSKRSTEKEEYWISELVILLSHSTKARICSHIRAVFNPTYHVSELMRAYPSIAPLWDEITKNEQERVARNANKLKWDCEMFVRYLMKKNILSVYYGFQIYHSKEKLESRILSSTRPVWFIFNQLTQYPKLCVKTTMAWFKDHLDGMKEDFMCWLLPLLQYLGVLSAGEKPMVDLSAYPMSWDRNRAGEELIMNDYVVDRHTKMGRSKTITEFAEVGALVDNESSDVNPLWKAFYDDGKRYEDRKPIIGENPQQQQQQQQQQGDMKEQGDVKEANLSYSGEIKNRSEEDEKDTPLESEEYDFVVRTQITTSNAKMDVYLARDSEGQLVVVKGPYKSRKELDILKRNTEWKRQYQLPYLGFQIRRMIPDRWSEGVPLGARNKIDRTVPAYFIVFESVVSDEELVTKMHSSKVWPETEVVDWDQIPLHFDYQSRPLTPQENKDYVSALLYRYVMGVSDLADRNFLMVKGRVLSIDEDVENHEVDLYSDLRKKKAEYVYEWLRGNYRSLALSSWKVKDETNQAQQDRLKKVQDWNECLRLFRPSHVDEPEPKPKSEGVKPIVMVRPKPKPKDVIMEEVVVEDQKVQDSVKKAEDTKSSNQSASIFAHRYPAMNDNFVFIDNLYRSRLTLLDILRDRGYDVSKYERFSPAEATAAAGAFTGLSFHVTKKDNPQKECHIRYENVTQQKMKNGYFTEMVSDENCENTEIIVMMSVHVTDTHHAIALKEYMRLKEEPNEDGIRERRKLCVSFFSIDMIVINPMRHVLVPKHELVPEEEHKELLERLYVTSKSKLPEIKFHIDPIARCIGAVPGDIVKITRPSASAGEAVLYRVCAP